MDRTPRLRRPARRATPRGVLLTVAALVGALAIATFAGASSGQPPRDGSESQRPPVTAPRASVVPGVPSTSATSVPTNGRDAPRPPADPDPQAGAGDDGRPRPQGPDPVPDPTNPSRCRAATPTAPRVDHGDPLPEILELRVRVNGQSAAVVAVGFRSPCGISFNDDGTPRRATGTSIGAVLADPCEGVRFSMWPESLDPRFGGVGAQPGNPGTCEAAPGAIAVGEGALTDGDWTAGTLEVPVSYRCSSSSGRLTIVAELEDWAGRTTMVTPEDVAAGWPDAVLPC